VKINSLLYLYPTSSVKADFILVLLFKMQLRTQAFFGFAAAVAVLAQPAAAEEFLDTPLTTEMFHLISKSDPSKENHNEAFENLLYSYPKMATARTADKRGAAWWGWEFENTFALGALIAYGDDVKKADEDADGNAAMSMCPSESDCDELYKEATAIAEEVKTRREERKAKDEAEFEDDEDDDDDDFASTDSPSPSGKKGDLDIAVDDEDEDL